MVSDQVLTCSAVDSGGRLNPAMAGLWKDEVTWIDFLPAAIGHNSILHGQVAEVEHERGHLCTGASRDHLFCPGGTVTI